MQRRYGAVQRSATATGAGQASAATGGGSPRGGQDYVIQRGDTLSRIAQRAYGRASLWREIMRANPTEVHRGGNLIYTGHTLHLPLMSVPDAESTNEAEGGEATSDAPTTEAVETPPEAATEPDELLGPPGVCSAEPIDHRAVFTSLSTQAPERRRATLMEIRDRGEWESFLDALGPGDVAEVQSWLPAQEGQGDGFTLDERIGQAHNSARGQAALAAVNAVAAVDVNDPPRITERLRELLTLGVALPALEGNDLASEGILSVNSARRAAKALVAMPAREYMRILGQLQLVGDRSAMNQSFNILKAVAARLDQYLDTDAGNDSLEALEGFADAIREMDDADLVRQTSVSQIDPADTGMQQRFTMSCNVTSAVTVRANADPLEALRLHQQGDLAIDSLGGEVARQTERGLENHNGNVAVARQPSTVTATVDAAITALAATAPAGDLAAVSDYMAGRAFDAPSYQRGIRLVRAELANDGQPNDQAMRLVRETAKGGPQPGLNADALQTEWNGSLGVDEVTGQTAAVDWDSALWALYMADNNGDGQPDRLIPSPVPTTWTTRISAMLTRAQPRLEAGDDVSFNVYWHGGGGHTMTFTNVRDVDGAVSYLIHDTWTGVTTWTLKSDILQANWPGVSAQRGLLCGVIG